MTAKRSILFVLGAAAALVSTLVIVTIFNIRIGQVGNNPKIDETAAIAKKLNHLVHRIDSCTSPHGKCARNGQKRTSDIAHQLALTQIRIAAAQTACQARGLTTFEDNFDCIAKLVASGGKP